MCRENLSRGFYFLDDSSPTQNYQCSPSYIELNLLKFKNYILKFQTNLILNLDVDNVVLCQPANFQLKILYI
jgi:hypothetical protein